MTAKKPPEQLLRPGPKKRASRSGGIRFAKWQEGMTVTPHRSKVRRKDTDTAPPRP